uniref:NADH dehydrogenase subunit 2 n=1 Tax=Macropsidius duuschulus TaxID=2479914 RepID=UPI002E7829AB|nr:NADH dehydrogenase subunit 2 [Macropsidius duuschulus]WRK21466.1 NADH dehydrogenase subunit 2 [Macropsidius duuschulus]
MNLNLTKILFVNSIMIGVMMAISSNNWISLWTSMEIGVLSVVPLMTQEKISSDSPIKYFIVQSVSSSIMIMGMMTLLSMINFKILMTQAMLIKIGASPFHTWILSMIENVEYYVLFILFTLIKIPGLLTLSILNEQLKFWSILSMAIGSIMVINQSSIKKMLSYSSIYNLGVMMSSMNENQIWVLYMLMYSFMLMLILMMIKKLKINYLNQMIINELETMTKISIWISLLSMAGLPPMMGFTIKMVVLEKMIMKTEFLLTSIMLMSSMVMMFMYMRISFLAMTLYSTSIKWKMFKKSNTDIKIMIINLTSTPIMLTLKSLS